MLVQAAWSAIKGRNWLQAPRGPRPASPSGGRRSRRNPAAMSTRHAPCRSFESIA
jgi:hypothetical protein